MFFIKGPVFVISLFAILEFRSFHDFLSKFFGLRNGTLLCCNIFFLRGEACVFNMLIQNAFEIIDVKRFIRLICFYLGCPFEAT